MNLINERSRLEVFQLIVKNVELVTGTAGKKHVLEMEDSIEEC